MVSRIESATITEPIKKCLEDWKTGIEQVYEKLFRDRASCEYSSSELHGIYSYEYGFIATTWEVDFTISDMVIHFTHNFEDEEESEDYPTEEKSFDLELMIKELGDTEEHAYLLLQNNEETWMVDLKPGIPKDLYEDFLRQVRDAIAPTWQTLEIPKN